jgi:hypothetical protein
VPRVPDADDALGLAGGLVRDCVPGSLFKSIEAAFVGAYERIMRTCRHRSSCRRVRSASRTFARYPTGMAKARVRKPDGRKSKAPADDANRAG